MAKISYHTSIGDQPIENGERRLSAGLWGEMAEIADSTLDLSGLLTVRTISDARDAFLKSFKGAHAVNLKISEESEIDVAGIQLILAARAYARETSKHLSLAAPMSERALNVMERGGFLSEMSAEDRQFWFCEGA